MAVSFLVNRFLAISYNRSDRPLVFVNDNYVFAQFILKANKEFTGLIILPQFYAVSFSAFFMPRAMDYLDHRILSDLYHLKKIVH